VFNNLLKAYQENILRADPVPVHVADGQPPGRLLSLLRVPVQLAPLVKSGAVRPLLLFRRRLVRAGVGVEVCLTSGVVHGLIVKFGLEPRSPFSCRNVKCVLHCPPLIVIEDYQTILLSKEEKIYDKEQL
jgi:hypothetical protein